MTLTDVIHTSFCCLLLFVYCIKVTVTTRDHDDMSLVINTTPKPVLTRTMLTTTLIVIYARVMIQTI